MEYLQRVNERSGLFRVRVKEEYPIYLYRIEESRSCSLLPELRSIYAILNR